MMNNKIMNGKVLSRDKQPTKVERVYLEDIKTSSTKNEPVSKNLWMEKYNNRFRRVMDKNPQPEE